jgi:ferric-dicitrate binding protein FerR (iron transport regulator)
MSFERLGKHIARENEAFRARSLDRAAVRAQLAGRRARTAGARSRRWGMSVLAGSLAAAAAWALWVRTPPQVRAPASRTLEARLEHSQQPLAAGAFVEAPDSDALGLRFSDGTRIEMMAGARARLVELDGNGAHVLLESGEARVDVIPVAHARWRISAGPFSVHVTGTRFDVQWVPQDDRFELDLERGRVEISGCAFGQDYRMRAGQVVQAWCKRGQLELSERSQRGGAAASASVTTPASAALAEPAQAARASEPAPGARSRAPDRRVEEAPERDEFEQRCERASGEQLVLLADTARRARDFDHEVYALRLLRRRFAGTPPGALAAFAFGRLEFDVRGDHRKAAEWFGRYLKEQPTGPLAREAHGRLIEATLAAGDSTRARELAKDYLRKYPDGPHVEIARRLQEAPAP